MIGTPHKPRLLFFQFSYDENLPRFLLIHAEDHVKCLSHFFDVTVIRRDCDYGQVCDQHEPDLVLFESGVNHRTCRRLKISNTRAHGHLPKLALHNADSFCIARAGLLSDLDCWGIETVFSITTTAAEHTPEIADRLFVWPNAIDPSIYRHYGENKNIPVLFSGNTTELYPWRQRILRLVPERVPSLICPHPGYAPGAAAHILVGEKYARLINASMVVPACGTVAKEIVRKHFEIPGCRACLLTERSAALEAAGFVDMENCIFADESDVIDKLEYIFKTPEELERITASGYRLVHDHHTFEHRDQIVQWYRLWKRKEPNQRIVQTSPFGPLEVVGDTPNNHTVHISGNGVHLDYLRKGDQAFSDGDFDKAEQLYVKCLNYIGWMPEPKIRIALCRLSNGDAHTAHSWISGQIEFVLGSYGAVDPDPVEWAYYIISLACLGKLNAAERCAERFPWLRHPELDRARRIIVELNGLDPSSLRLSDEAKRRPTIHHLPELSWERWLARISFMFRQCGQERLAKAVLRCSETSPGLNRVGSLPPDTCQNPTQAISNGNRQAIGQRHKAIQFRWQLRYREVRSATRVQLGRVFHAMEKRFGYFLPYYLSEMRRDDFFSSLETIAKDDAVGTIVIVGGESLGHLEAICSGAMSRDLRPKVFCVDRPSHRFGRLKKRFSDRVTFVTSSPEDPRNGLNTDMAKADALVIATSALNSSTLSSMLAPMQEARDIVLDHINRSDMCEIHDRLLNDENYVLLLHDPSLRNGYAIFRRKPTRSIQFQTARLEGRFPPAKASIEM